MKKSFLRKIVEFLGYVIFILFFVFITSQVFFKKQSDDFLREMFSLIIQNDQTISKFKDSLAIVYPTTKVNINPLDYDFYGRQVIANIFDPLILLDKNFRPSSGLALSYGFVDEKTWNFILRKGIKFHDGSDFNFNDVEKTFELALASDILGSYLSSVEKLQKINDYEFNIITKYSDPLLLSKLSALYIVSDNFSSDNPLIGTGPYVFDKQSLNEFYLYPNLSYWCSVPLIKEFKIIFENDANKRIDLLLEGNADFLAFVPQNSVSLIRQYGFDVVSLPSLEVQFLLFNFNSPIFKNLEMRKRISILIDKEQIISKMGEFLTISNQFVGSGVFGFNSEISRIKSESLLKNRISNVSIDFVLAKSLELLGNTIKSQLREAGLIVNLRLIDDDKIEEELQKNDFDMYFMAFKSEFGDAGEFYDLVVKNNAENNYLNYKSDKVDLLIEESKFNLDINLRLKQLKEIMKIIVEDDVIGVPLFEYDVFYGFSKDFSFQPRLDGIIYLNDIIQKR